MASSTTPRYQFPFPNLTGQDPSVPVDVEASMQAVESSLGATDDSAVVLASDVAQAQADITALEAAGGDFPAGVVNLYAGQTPPPGWLICDGSNLSATSYPDLYTAIRYTYGGAGDTFTLPNLQNRVPVGVDPGNTSIGQSGGEATHAVTQAELPGHSHTIAHSHSASTGATGNHQHPDGGIHSSVFKHDAGGVGNDWQVLNPAHSHSTGFTGNHSHSVSVGGSNTSNSGTTGSSTPMSIMQPYVVMYYMIRY